MRTDRRKTEALVQGGVNACAELGLRVSRAELLAELHASAGLLNFAERVSELLKRKAREQGVSLAGRVSDP